MFGLSRLLRLTISLIILIVVRVWRRLLPWRSLLKSCRMTLQYLSNFTPHREDPITKISPCASGVVVVAVAIGVVTAASDKASNDKDLSYAENAEPFEEVEKDFVEVEKIVEVHVEGEVKEIVFGDVRFFVPEKVFVEFEIVFVVLAAEVVWVEEIVEEKFVVEEMIANFAEVGFVAVFKDENGKPDIIKTVEVSDPIGTEEELGRKSRVK